MPDVPRKNDGSGDLVPMSPLGYPNELVGPGQTLESASAKIGDIVLKGQHPKSWWLGFTIAFALLMVFLMSVTWLLYKGVGIWGINIPVAWGFAIINFVWWIGIGHAGTFISAILLLVFQKWRNSINRWSVQQDETSNPVLTRRIRTFCGPGLLAFTLTVSLATVDWIMVLERNWYSTVFPALLIIGQILLTFAFCAAMLAWVVGSAPFDRQANPISGVVRVEHFHSLGNFLLAFVMMWAYLSVSQLIIIWSGNEPREIAWYLHRTVGAWIYIGIFLALFNFGLPFCLLLSRENKNNVRFITLLAHRHLRGSRGRKILADYAVATSRWPKRFLAGCRSLHRHRRRVDDRISRALEN